MNEFSQALIERSGYERDGLADVYDSYRPAPARALVRILKLLARTDRPRLVVDLGCGTGLSTRVWTSEADEVVGVEANGTMANRARRATDAPNVRYVEAYAAATGLPGGGADVVTCAQAFHWMEPQPVLAEAARLLRPGGVFAAVDYDVPPLVDPEVDDAFRRHFDSRRVARSRLGIEAGAARWPKEGHLGQIERSGRFAYAGELLCHGWSETDAAGIKGLAESIGGPRAIFGAKAPEVEETLRRLHEVAERVLGDRPRPMLTCYRVRFAVK